MDRYNGFFDTRQMHMYLSGSVIRYKGFPIYVTEVSESETIFYLLVGENGEDKPKRIGIKNKDIDLKPVSLGFSKLEYKNLTTNYVLSRIPARMYKIGLCSQNLRIDYVGLNYNFPYSSGKIIFSKSLKKTILGEYVSIEKALKEVTDNQNTLSCAFSRHFSIGSDKEINDKCKVQDSFTKLLLYYYKFTSPIGEIPDGKPILYEKYTFLQEHLGESINENM